MVGRHGEGDAQGLPKLSACGEAEKQADQEQNEENKGQAYDAAFQRVSPDRNFGFIILHLTAVVYTASDCGRHGAA